MRKGTGGGDLQPLAGRLVEAAVLGLAEGGVESADAPWHLEKGGRVESGGTPRQGEGLTGRQDGTRKRIYGSRAGGRPAGGQEGSRAFWRKASSVSIWLPRRFWTPASSAGSSYL